MMKANAKATETILYLYAALALVCWAAPHVQAQAAPSSRRFSQVAISPDGERVAWVEGELKSDGSPAPGKAVYVQELKAFDRPPRRIVASEKSMASADTIAWSPDNKQLAFFSDASGQTQLYVAGVEKGEGRRITNLTGYLAEPVWSPDGKSIALLFTENAPRIAGPVAAMTEETGVVDAKVYEQRLALVDLASGTVRQISPTDMYVHEYDWSPDSKSLALTAAPGAGDTNWYVARLYRLDAETQKMTELYRPPLQIAVPRWSPDGRNIAFIGGLMSDEGVTGGDIFMLPANGGPARNLTPGIATSPAAIRWVDPNTIAFDEWVDGQYGISSLETTTGKVSQLWAGPELANSGLAGVSLAANGKTSAVIRQSASRPPEIWAGEIGQWKQLTHANDEQHPAWGEMKSLHWMNGDTRVQGWLMYPAGYNPSHRYPMVVMVHGGPASMVYPYWPSNFSDVFELSARGYFVFYPNPRGSYGQGEKFTQANVKDFGYGDFQDILAGVDEIVKTLPVDNDRVGIAGWSYGGYMTMWAVTQTNRFRAAVAGAGISNWQSYYGENDIDEWMIPYFGASVYDDPAVYARSAPITFIKNVKTPTLILVGDRDGESPPPQSREFWHALKTLGVETELVIYPGEGHLFSQPEHRRERMDRLIRWFDRYLKP